MADQEGVREAEKNEGAMREGGRATTVFVAAGKWRQSGVKVKTDAVTVGTKETELSQSSCPSCLQTRLSLEEGGELQGVRLILADLSSVGLRQRQHLDRR